MRSFSWAILFFLLCKTVLMIQLYPQNLTILRFIQQNYNHIAHMQKKLVFLLATLALASIVYFQIQTSNQDYEFDQFKTTFKKDYQRPGEEEYRRLIFLQNKVKINAHNSDPTQTYLQGVTQFTDMTVPELNAMYADLKIPQQPQLTQDETGKGKVGVAIDWVEAGKVGPVIDQGQCGASWAFSAIGAFESRHMIKNNNILGSAQELLDCTDTYGNFGCNGGYMSYSFKYIKEKSIHETKDYPYTGKSEKCKNPVAGTTWTLQSYTETTKCDQMLNALSSGPVAVAVDMSGLYNYKSGIVTKCGTTPSSGSLLVGVTDDYWRLKQSFSVNWGESGFFRLARGNTCAVCSMASYPTI